MVAVPASVLVSMCVTVLWSILTSLLNSALRTKSSVLRSSTFLRSPLESCMREPTPKCAGYFWLCTTALLLPAEAGVEGVAGVPLSLGSRLVDKFDGMSEEDDCLSADLQVGSFFRSRSGGRTRRRCLSECAVGGVLVGGGGVRLDNKGGAVDGAGGAANGDCRVDDVHGGVLLTRVLLGRAVEDDGGDW